MFFCSVSTSHEHAQLLITRGRYLRAPLFMQIEISIFNMHVHNILAKPEELKHKRVGTFTAHQLNMLHEHALVCIMYAANFHFTSRTLRSIYSETSLSGPSQKQAKHRLIVILNDQGYSEAFYDCLLFHYTCIYIRSWVHTPYHLHAD